MLTTTHLARSLFVAFAAVLSPAAQQPAPDGARFQVTWAAVVGWYFHRTGVSTSDSRAVEVTSRLLAEAPDSPFRRATAVGVETAHRFTELGWEEARAELEERFPRTPEPAWRWQVRVDPEGFGMAEALAALPAVQLRVARLALAVEPEPEPRALYLPYAYLAASDVN